MFEALGERDLRVYAESLGARLYHYQDYAGKEIDAVIEMEDGARGLLEIKLGANQIEDAARGFVICLKPLRKTVESCPGFAAMSGLSNAAYQRADGVYVVPVTALRN